LEPPPPAPPARFCRGEGRPRHQQPAAARSVLADSLVGLVQQAALAVRLDELDEGLDEELDDELDEELNDELDEDLRDARVASPPTVVATLPSGDLLS